MNADPPVEVSVCVPVHNGAPFLLETLASILAQRHDRFEVIMADNASTDATPDILAAVADPRVRVLTYDQLLDLPANWQRLTDAATGTYVKVVCADDLLHPQALAAQADVLRRVPGVSLVASRRALVDAHTRVLARGLGLQGFVGRHRSREVVRALVRRGGINPVGEPAGVMFRRRDYAAVGGWSARYVYPMDIDLWVRLLSRGDLYGQAEDLAAFRVSPQALSSAHSRTQFDENHAFVRMVARDPHWQVPRREQWMFRGLHRAVWEAWPLRQRRMIPGATWWDTVGVTRP